MKFKERIKMETNKSESNEKMFKDYCVLCECIAKPTEIHWLRIFVIFHLKQIV